MISGGPEGECRTGFGYGRTSALLRASSSSLRIISSDRRAFMPFTPPKCRSAALTRGRRRTTSVHLCVGIVWREFLIVCLLVCCGSPLACAYPRCRWFRVPVATFLWPPSLPALSGGPQALPPVAGAGPSYLLASPRIILAESSCSDTDNIPHRSHPSRLRAVLKCEQMAL